MTSASPELFYTSFLLTDLLNGNPTRRCGLSHLDLARHRRNVIFSDEFVGFQKSTRAVNEEIKWLECEQKELLSVFINMSLQRSRQISCVRLCEILKHIDRVTIKVVP